MSCAVAVLNTVFVLSGTVFPLPQQNIWAMGNVWRRVSELFCDVSYITVISKHEPFVEIDCWFRFVFYVFAVLLGTLYVFWFDFCCFFSCIFSYSLSLLIVLPLIAHLGTGDDLLCVKWDIINSAYSLTGFLPHNDMLVWYMLLLCVCFPSHASIVWKQLPVNVESCKQCHTITQGLQFSGTKVWAKFCGHPNRGSKCRWGRLK